MSIRERSYDLSGAAVGTLLIVFIVYAGLPGMVDLSAPVARPIVGR